MVTNLEAVDSGGPDEATTGEIRRELDRLLKRLGGLTAAAWRVRRAAVVELLASLVELNAQLEGTSHGPVPDLPDYALADAVAVLAESSFELIQSAADTTALTELRDVISGALNRTV